MEQLKEYSTDLTDFTQDISSRVNDQKTLNQIFKQLLKNDLHIYGHFDNIPGVWFCGWYNDDRIPGYNKGDICWLNCEDKEEFLKNNAETIQKYANVNPFVLKKLPNWKSNDDEVYQQYNNVLTGYMDPTKAKPLSALYEIGELSAPIQLMVSQCDNNKFPLSDREHWKQFFVDSEDDYDVIIDTIQHQNLSTIANHEFMYHFGDETLTYDIRTSLYKYANADFSNVQSMYANNYLSNDRYSSGFDTVECYFRKPLANYSDSNGNLVEYVWFRLWRSGYLEHGGTINVKRYLNDVLSNEVIIPFGWSLVSDGAKAYDLKYLGIDGSMISVDETQEIPPGDNLISVLYELDELIIHDSNKAPIFYNNEYTIQLTPIQTSDPYSGLGNHSPSKNSLNVEIMLEDKTKDGFKFKYDSKNVPEYYTYYTAGFTR